jgi:cephalosporin hydroxylase
VAADVVREVAELIGDARSTMVILDSDHTKAHVLAEMEAYAPFVSFNNYLVVEDTNINGHPAYPSFGDGPWEAVAAFTSRRDDFETDLSREKFFLTFNPNGYLRRVK